MEKPNQLLIQKQIFLGSGLCASQWCIPRKEGLRGPVTCHPYSEGSGAPTGPRLLAPFSAGVQGGYLPPD